MERGTRRGRRRSVACVSESLCVGTCAVGFGFVLTPCPGGTYDQGDVVTWNPTSSAASISFATISDVGLSGVWCGPTGVCFAGSEGKLLVSADPAGGAGAWSVSYVDPNPNAVIAAVGCATAFCIAVDSTGQATVGTQLTSSQIQTLLRGQLVPTGRAARIGALVRHHTYTLRFHAATAGRLRISWYACRHCSPAAAKRKVRVAGGARTYASATELRVRLTLTRRGKRLLKASRRLQITAVASFTPTGQPAITATSSFRLRR